MEGILNFNLFVISGILIVAIPGQDFIYVMTRGVALGRKAGVLSAAGISVGLVIHTLLAAFGLSVILQSSKIAFQVIQYAGAAYLLYLGVMTLRSKDQIIKEETGEQVNRNGIFIQGVLTNVFNPKALLVFIAFLPQFIHSSVTQPAKQLLILGCTLSVIAILWFSIVGYFAGMIGSFVKRNKIVREIIKWAAGSVLIGLGIRLAFQKNS